MIADGMVLNLLRQANTFGLNLARIDIRQESNRHHKLIHNVCKKKRLGDYESWSEEKKISFLSKHFLHSNPSISHCHLGSHSSVTLFLIPQITHFPINDASYD